MAVCAITQLTVRIEPPHPHSPICGTNTGYQWYQCKINPQPSNPGAPDPVVELPLSTHGTLSVQIRSRFPKGVNGTLMKGRSPTCHPIQMRQFRILPGQTDAPPPRLGFQGARFQRGGGYGVQGGGGGLQGTFAPPGSCSGASAVMCFTVGGGGRSIGLQSVGQLCSARNEWTGPHTASCGAWAWASVMWGGGGLQGGYSASPTSGARSPCSGKHAPVSQYLSRYLCCRATKHNAL